MLVLTRDQGQSIFVGENILITLLSARGGRARIGIQAPDELEIVRSEIKGEWISRRERKNKPTKGE